MLVLYGMYNSIQFGSVEDKSTTYIYLFTDNQMCIITDYPKKFHYEYSIHEANCINNRSEVQKY